MEQTVKAIREVLMGELAKIQNTAFYASQDIMTFAGMCTNGELMAYIGQKRQTMGA